MRLLALSAGALAVLSGGCSYFCTQVGCDDSLRIETSEALPAVYTVEIETPTGEAIVDCSAAGAGAGAARAGTVSGSLDLVVGCEARAFTIHSTLPAAHVRVVAEDGTVLGEASFAPAYDDVYANGEDCGVTCRRAEVALATLPLNAT